MKPQSPKDGSGLELETARIYALLGAQVETRQLLRGYEIDVIATFQLGPLRMRVLAECKEYSRPRKVSDQDMRGFAVKLLAAREAGLADKGIFITTSDFTKTAKQTANRHSIQCLTLEQLRNELVDFRHYLDSSISVFEKTPLFKYYIDQRASDIEDFSTILSDEEAQQFLHSPLVNYVAELFLSGEQRIALLGNFGTGKSSFCEKYCYDSLLAYNKDSSRRLPVRINLRDFRSGIDIQQLIISVLQRNHGVKINERLSLELQRMGRFVFLLDGLDEMSTKVDRAVLNENLRELSRLATDGDNQYLLTCRTHFFQERVVDEFLEEYRVLYLLDWDQFDLRRYLRKRFSRRWRQIFGRITGNSRLEELSRTPQFVDMLLSGLPGGSDDADLRHITSLQVYEKYVDKWIDRESRRRGAVMRPEQRGHFVEFLAMKVFEGEVAGLHFSELYEVAREFSGYDDATRLDYFDNDVRSCTFITRNSRGVYGFRHRSFMEYGCARIVRREIGSGRPSLLERRELTEEIIRFLGEMSFGDPAIEQLHAWSCLEGRKSSERILSKNAARILLALKCELRGMAAERFSIIDDPWTRIGAALASSDPTAFDRAVEESYSWLLSYVAHYTRLYSLLGDEVSPDEILQEVLMSLLTQRERFDSASQATFRSFISARVRHHILDRARLVQRRQEVPLEIVERSMLPVLGVVESSQITQLEMADAWRRIEAELSEEEVRIFRDRFLEGKTWKELAADYSVSPETAKRWLYSARKKALNALADQQSRRVTSKPVRKE